MSEPAPVSPSSAASSKRTFSWDAFSTPRAAKSTGAPKAEVGQKRAASMPKQGSPPEKKACPLEQAM
eukprot:15465030-Alexandrium_andersonii.AAC.1